MSMLSPRYCDVTLEPAKVGYMKMVTSNDVKNGLPAKNVSFERSSVADTFKGISASDFSIANYLAMGIIDTLKVGTFANTDIDAISQMADEALNIDQNVQS